MDAAAAGTFYILLRGTEIVGGLGATSSDTSLASLAGESVPSRRAENFCHSYKYALIFCLHGALVIGFLTPDAYLPAGLSGEQAPLSSGTGWAALAAYGLAGAFSKVVINAAMGTGMVRMAAIGNLVEAGLVLTSSFVLQADFWSYHGLFVGAGLASAALLPTAHAPLSRNFAQTSFETWIVPVGF